MKKTSRYWIISLLLGLILWLGLPSCSYANSQPINSTDNIIHVLNRLNFGPAPGDIERVKSMGVETYIQSQLRPETISESPKVTQEIAQFKTINLTPVQIYNEYGPLPPKQQKKLTEEQRKARNKRMRTVLQDTRKARLLRAISSQRQLQEVMVDFWFNHFNIAINKGRLNRLWVGTYERDAIRPYTLGNFRDLLGATAHHPVMLFYLDNWLNSAPGSEGSKGRFKGLNENYARELMELHTLGVDGGYKQEDIITLARIFTGWGIVRRTGDGSGFEFYANRHDNSDKIFLGVPIKGGGMEEGEKALDILANHPSTARYISYKLAQFFVADSPPKTLVNRLAKRFQETNGNIRFVLTALFDSPEFWDTKYYNSKFKNPYQYIISTARATGTDNPRFGRINGMLNQLGMPMFSCVTPDGYKNTKEAWLNPDGMMRRVSFATPISRGGLSEDKSKKNRVESVQLMATLGNNLSPETKEIVINSPENLQAALILGSPEMMQR
ncbi:MAG: DUF1800 domain-containing protein [Microcoleaceae cyanobacterium]